MIDLDTVRKYAHPDELCVSGEIARALLRAHSALEIIDGFNPMHNDLDAYLHRVAEWGMGETDTQPNPDDFGIDSSPAERAG